MNKCQVPQWDLHFPLLSPTYTWNILKKKALASYPLKPDWWKRFVDDTNIKWDHGRENLEGFFKHLNSISTEIKFTMEVEENRSIYFLDILVTTNEDGTLGHQVFRKKTHIDSYLHAESYHHPAQKFGVLNTRDVRAIRIYDTKHLNDEINHLFAIFRDLGYKYRDIKKALERAKGSILPRNRHEPQENMGRVLLPYIKEIGRAHV